MISLHKNICLRVCEVARESGRWMKNERQHFSQNSVEKKGVHDLVSYVDKESETRIIESLKQIITDAGFIAEENTSNTRGERYNWIIDPLDGTTNYIQGIPLYAVSIALMDVAEIVCAVVYEVGQDECFYAWKGGGAYLNGMPLKVSTKLDMDDSLLATGFPYTQFSQINEYTDFLKWAMQHARGVRRMGSAATDLAYVACGRFDAFWEYDLNPWDVAAGALIVVEAGGVVSDFSGGKEYVFGKQILASTPLIADTMLSKLTKFIEK